MKGLSLAVFETVLSLTSVEILRLTFHASSKTNLDVVKTIFGDVGENIQASRSRAK